MRFVPRTTAPAENDKHWIHTSKGGLNECIMRNETTGAVLPNCVGYCWGRWYEATGERPRLSRNNAENWFGYNDGYERGMEPRVGAIACWYGKGSLAGHVEFVEEIDENGNTRNSASNYSGTRWYMSYRKKSNNYAINSNYTFQGFIYPPKPVKEAKPLSNEPIKMKIGYASKGDVKTICMLLDQLAIGYTVDNGYIVTSVAVSKGDQVDIVDLCEELGILCVECIDLGWEDEQKNNVIERLEKQLAESKALYDELLIKLTDKEKELATMKERAENAIKILSEQ